jgi:alpha-amylase
MKFKLAFALHNHQPVGNFSAVFEEAHTKCYQAFLELVKKYPSIEFSLHQSGILWNWQKEHHPDFFTLIGEMVDSGQVELLSGAFYEPILPVIPDRDKIGQIQMLTGFLQDHFEVTPRGMWLAERIWEPHLPNIINECGIRYLPLDDTHFKYAGLKEEQLYGTYVTEEAGKTVTLMPILEKLRYLIPFGEPEKVIDFLSQAASRHPGGLAIYADDGEKFGIWPDTHKHCYLDGWLEKFFTLLEKNSDWLEVISLGKAVEESKPIGRIYLPTASYSEMLHWALPSDGYTDYEDFESELKESGLYENYGHFVRGGHWRGFLAKYPEANLMHKKMLAVSDLFEKVRSIPGIDNNELENARELLYAGQCNCPYWHGVFGGLYLPHLRWAIYRKLVKAEKILRRLSGTKVYAGFDDFDRDGYNDIALGGENLSMVICPNRGGQIVELVSIDNHLNFADCLTRREEGYHRKLIEMKSKTDDESTKSIHDIVAAKEEGLDRLLVYDWHLRRPLTDHFLADGTTVEKFMTGKYYELGDFILEPFETGFVENDYDYQVTLTRRGHVWQGDFHCSMKLEKLITFPKRGNIIEIQYRLVQNNLEIMPINFGVEFDFNLLAPVAEDRYALIDGKCPKESNLAAVGEAVQASKIEYLDENQKVGIQIASDQSAKIWRLPIYTVSLSEAGFEKVFQGNCTMFVFDCALRSGNEFAVTFKLFAGPLGKMPGVSEPNRFAANNV